MAIDLLTPVLDDAAKTINFFNGRLLSGEDLTAEQAANREGRRLLGQAIGEGMVHGLEVVESKTSTREAPSVAVKAGLAVNRNGRVVRLAQDEVVSLRPTRPSDTTQILEFEDCVPPQTGSYVADAGVYLLTIAPVQVKVGRAPVSGLGNLSANCNSRYVVDGARFNLLQLGPPDLPAELLGDPNRLRNRVAYRCFGAADENVTRFIADPFGTSVERYGLFDALRPSKLTNCEVPLAMLYWTAEGVQWIDAWMARRRLTRRAAVWAYQPLFADRRMAEAEAMFLQFQEQAREMLRTESNLPAIRAEERFEFLPPAGLLPIDMRSTRAFDYRQFFSNTPFRGVTYIEGAQAPAILRASLSYPPIDVHSRELIWLYLVRENIRAIDAGRGNQPKAYALFTSGHMGYRGPARHDLNRWDYSNTDSEV